MLNLQPVRERLGPDFEPFVISLSDGRRFEIPHRDFIAVGVRVVVVLDTDDRSYKVDPLHIVSVDDVNAERNSNGN